MIEAIPPAAVLIVGSLFIPLFRGRVKYAYMLFLPLLTLWILYQLPYGTYWVVNFLDYKLILGRVDKLSLVFSYIFALLSLLGVVFALKVDDDLQHVSALMYAGSALGVTLAGDFFSLFFFWELMAVSSAFLILARKTEASQAAGFRYILVHVIGGLFLLAGIILYVQETGSIHFGRMELTGVGPLLILMGIALNAAVPPLHAWLIDAYPQATVTGAVFMCAITTKNAVYLMARTFPGTELLIWVGVFMAAYPVFYGLLENDVRRVLSYSIINQGGIMMVGVGMGTALALNGAVSHALCSVLYTSLLFMAAGAVLQETGRIKCTELGGLYGAMPWTCLFFMIGGASISGIPLFCGFVSKTMTVSAAAHQGLPFVWWILQLASVGAFLFAALKVGFFTFFGKDRGIRAQEPSWNMLLAMGLAAALCLLVGVYPRLLYRLLPYPVDYAPYSGAHVVGHLQAVLGAALAFYLAVRLGYYPAERRAVNLEMDWLYRKGGELFYRLMDRGLNGLNDLCERVLVQGLAGEVSRFFADAPARMVVLLMLPWWRIKGLPEEELERRREAIHQILATGTSPVGLSAGAATLFLIVVFSLG